MRRRKKTLPKMLFTPIKIGHMEVRNRILMPAMGTNFAAPDGSPTDRQIEYYAARARGGAGIVTTEVTEIDRRGKATPFSVAIWDDCLIPKWQKLADAVHAGGAKLVVQLHHAGRETNAASTGGLRPVAPSPLPCPMCKDIPHELTIEEIEEVIEMFGDGARRARESGCDGVELHGAHGYLIAQFMSPYSNRRSDEYGGSLQSRLRFPIEVINRVRRKAGHDFPIIFRIAADEMVEGGYNVDHTRIICRLLEEAGVDAFNISRAAGYAFIRWIQPPTGLPMGLNAPWSAAIKSAIKVPVAVVGRINDPLIAEHLLEQGYADMVAIGRQLIADPDWPKKVAAGDFDDIIPCTSCNQGCLVNVLMGVPITCSVNPTVGRESEMEIHPAGRSKKVLVAGGGPAGLEAARVAALRGHDVTLLEKERRLGGQYAIAVNPPMKQELSLVTKYLITQAKKAGVKIQLGKEVTPALVSEMKPDALVVATGAAPSIPDIPGIGNNKVASAHDVLDGKVSVGTGKVVIIGGGMIGCETADYVAERAANEVIVLEMASDIAVDMPPWNKEFLMERLAACKVRIVTLAKVKEILEDGVTYLNQNGAEETIRGVDHIVVATGVRSVDQLSAKLKDKVGEIFVIGDAKKPRKALDAVAEGAEVGRKL